MKTFILAAILIFITVTGAQASEVIVVQESTNHCEGQDPHLLDKALTSAKGTCLRISGYPSAQLVGTPVYHTRITGWGSGQNCSLMKNSSIKASFKCLNRNR